MAAELGKRMVETESTPRDMKKVAYFLLFLGAGFVVFVLDSSYIRLFPTNESTLFKALVPAAFLGAALLFRRHPPTRAYWQVTYAFFVAAAAFLIAWLFEDVDGWLLSSLGLAPESAAGLALEKVTEVVLVVVPILLLSRLVGWDLGSLYIRRGRLAFGVTVGALVLMNFGATALAVAANTTGHLERLVSELPWMLLFAFSNAFMEELWFRGLFLARMTPFVGNGGALLATSLIFTASHMGALYLSDALLVLFLVLLFPLAVGFGWLMQQSRALWGSTIFHGAADLFWFIIFGF